LKPWEYANAIRRFIKWGIFSLRRAFVRRRVKNRVRQKISPRKPEKAIDPNAYRKAARLNACGSIGKVKTNLRLGYQPFDLRRYQIVFVFDIRIAWVLPSEFLHHLEKRIVRKTLCSA
jgi:hypothetical protein